MPKLYCSFICAGSRLNYAPARLHLNEEIFFKISYFRSDTTQCAVYQWLEKMVILHKKQSPEYYFNGNSEFCTKENSHENSVYDPFCMTFKLENNKGRVAFNKRTLLIYRAARATQTPLLVTADKSAVSNCLKWFCNSSGLWRAKFVKCLKTE